MQLGTSKVDKIPRRADEFIEQRGFEGPLLFDCKPDKNTGVRIVPILFGFKIQTDGELLKLRNAIRLALQCMIRFLFGVDTSSIRIDAITPVRIIDKVHRVLRLLFRISRTQRQDEPAPSF